MSTNFLQCLTQIDEIVFKLIEARFKLIGLQEIME